MHFYPINIYAWKTSLNSSWFEPGSPLIFTAHNPHHRELYIAWYNSLDIKHNINTHRCCVFHLSLCVIGTTGEGSVRVAEPAVRERNGDLPITETSEEPVKNEERRLAIVFICTKSIVAGFVSSIVLY